MVQVYVKLIINGRRTLEEVPSVIREDVFQALVEIGYFKATSLNNTQ